MKMRGSIKREYRHRNKRGTLILPMILVTIEMILANASIQKMLGNQEVVEAKMNKEKKTARSKKNNQLVLADRNILIKSAQNKKSRIAWKWSKDNKGKMK